MINSNSEILHAKRCLALVFYAHDHYDFRDSLSFYRAMTDRYIPFGLFLKRFTRERSSFPVSVSFSPLLLTLLSKPSMQDGYTAVLSRRIRAGGPGEEHLRRLTEVKNFFDDIGGDLVKYLRSLADTGGIELMATTATNAFLPYLKTDDGIRAQVEGGVIAYQKHFGRDPRGFLLPELSYCQGLDGILSEFELKYFVCDAGSMGVALPTLLQSGMIALPAASEPSLARLSTVPISLESGETFERDAHKMIDSTDYTLVTPSFYLEDGDSCDDVVPGSLRCSFGSRGGTGESWLNTENHWIYRYTHKMEELMIELTQGYRGNGKRPVIVSSAIRELLAAQSGGWALRMNSSDTRQAAIDGFLYHVDRFHSLYHAAKAGDIDTTSADLSELSVLMLSWEYPPFNVGGLSKHVSDLSRALAAEGVDVRVVTCAADGALGFEVNDGVYVYRVLPDQRDTGNFIDWIFQLNLAMLERCRTLLRRGLRIDVIHCHDWLTSYAAETLCEEFGIPLVATIHATEYGRNNGIHTELQLRIHELEAELVTRASRVIVCSRYMADELKRFFGTPGDKTAVIPNGADIPDRSEPVPMELRRRFALDSERIVFFVGRCVREKGIQVLLESIHDILAECPDAKFVISGKGPMLDELRCTSSSLGLGSKVLFTGYVDDATRNTLMKSAALAVFPSLYEPFGIVALEAMATGVPVVVSDTGGLAEIVDHGVDGLKALPGDRNSLSLQIRESLKFPDKSRSLAEKARNKVRSVYSWGAIACRTKDLYHNMKLR